MGGTPASRDTDLEINTRPLENVALCIIVVSVVKQDPFVVHNVNMMQVMGHTMNVNPLRQNQSSPVSVKITTTRRSSFVQIVTDPCVRIQEPVLAGQQESGSTIATIHALFGDTIILHGLRAIGFVLVLAFLVITENILIQE